MAIEAIGRHHSLLWPRTIDTSGGPKSARAQAGSQPTTPATTTDEAASPSPALIMPSPVALAPVPEDTPEHQEVHGRAHVMQTLHRLDRQVRQAIREAVSGMDGLSDAEKQQLVALEKDFRSELHAAFHDAGRGGSFDLSTLKTDVAAAVQDLLGGIVALKAKYAPAPEATPPAPVDTSPEPAVPADPAPDVPVPAPGVEPLAPATTEPRDASAEPAVAPTEPSLDAYA